LAWLLVGIDIDPERFRKRRLAHAAKRCPAAESLRPAKHSNNCVVNTINSPAWECGNPFALIRVSPVLNLRSLKMESPSDTSVSPAVVMSPDNDTSFGPKLNARPSMRFEAQRRSAEHHLRQYIDMRRGIWKTYVKHRFLIIPHC
jgi:hypothetical protein